MSATHYPLYDILREAAEKAAHLYNWTITITTSNATNNYTDTIMPTTHKPAPFPSVQFVKYALGGLGCAIIMCLALRGPASFWDRSNADRKRPLDCGCQSKATKEEHTYAAVNTKCSSDEMREECCVESQVPVDVVRHLGDSEAPVPVIEAVNSVMLRTQY